MTANCVRPGFVATRFGDQSGGMISRVFGLANLFAMSPKKGAETLVYLDSSPDVAETTGAYFYKYLPIQPSQEEEDDKAASLLWERTADLAGLKA